MPTYPDTGCVYDKDNMSALSLMNASESDPRSYVVTSAVTKKAQKTFWGSNRIQTHDLHDTGVMLSYWLSYEALLEAGQVEPVGASEFVLGFICNYLSYYIKLRRSLSLVFINHSALIWSF